jgi:histidinol-phosphate aminotransferase
MILRHATPRYAPIIDALPAAVPFIGPETQERAAGAPFAARLGANENGFGPSPRAISAMSEAATDIWKYGDSESYHLRAALAAQHEVGAENILIGEGIDGLLGYLVRLFIAQGDAVVTSAGAYPTFNYHVKGFGGVIHTVPYANDHEDPTALIAKAVETGAKLIYIANPDNPMGTHHGAQKLQRMIEAVPSGSLLILDEAYVEFAPEGTSPAIDPNDPRVIRMRTFSKAYALAGARIGYALGHADLIGSFDKIRNHFGINRIAQAGALAAQADHAWLARGIAQVARAREEISRIARMHGLMPLPSATNFVALDCGADGAFAKRVLTELSARGIFVRMPFVAPQDRCIRVSCGPDAEIKAFAQALPEALRVARG